LVLGFAIHLQKFVWDSSATAANSPPSNRSSNEGDSRLYFF
jgi:hypothetical protein